MGKWSAQLKDKKELHSFAWRDRPLWRVCGVERLMIGGTAVLWTSSSAWIYFLEQCKNIADADILTVLRLTNTGFGKFKDTDILDLITFTRNDLPANPGGRCTY